MICQYTTNKNLSIKLITQSIEQFVNQSKIAHTFLCIYSKDSITKKNKQETQ